MCASSARGAFVPRHRNRCSLDTIAVDQANYLEVRNPFIDRPHGITRVLFRAPVALYRARLGFLFGSRFLLLVHRGRVTGRTRRNVLEVMEYKPETGEYIVLSGWGPQSQWYRNIQVAPPIEVRIGFRTFTPAVRSLDATEAADALGVYAREHPLMMRMLAKALAWRYDGTRAALERIVADRPMVGLRPARPAPMASSGAIDHTTDTEAEAG